MASLEETVEGPANPAAGMPPAKVKRSRASTADVATAIGAFAGTETSVGKLGESVNKVVAALSGLAPQSQMRVIKAAKLLLGGR